MDDLFEFDNAAGGATHQNYDCLGSLVYRLELLGALVFLCWLVYCVPIATEFLRRLSAFVSAPPFVFVFFNAVIFVIALSVKFGVYSAADNVSARENNGANEEVKEVEEEVQLLREEVPARNDDVSGKSFFEDLNSDADVGVKDKEVIMCEEKTASENENPVDALSCEEFKKEIENFIEKMKTFRRQEYWVESLMEKKRNTRRLKEENYVLC